MKDNVCSGLQPIRQATNRYSVGHCLRCLFDDKTHSMLDQAVPGLTYMELIGVLLGAKDLIEAKRKPDDHDDPDEE